MQIGNRDIEKMIDYYSKGSDPDVLARTVKDLNKAKARAVIANAMGWTACRDAFIDRCEELGATAQDLSDIDYALDSFELPANYREKFEGGPKLQDATRFRDKFPKLFSVLRDHGVTKFTLTSRRPTFSELEMDSRNGSCWTLAYTLNFDYNGQPVEWKIANHSNEGGGSYGVSSSSLGVWQAKQQTLANAAQRELDRMAAETASVHKFNVSKIVDQVLAGGNVRTLIRETIEK